ncbi:hypothetical protein NM688_g583 [Phlebia brevispora]|uniref:Uncharacterized protein n=1 Tax=Phlebia brevispora TaxID=194682 RepID=A0ACC1TEB1_9APHY|nr:hypothetical protein NM688_g583 [Phlebia brevispora]
MRARDPTGARRSQHEGDLAWNRLVLFYVYIGEYLVEWDTCEPDAAGLHGWKPFCAVAADLRIFSTFVVIDGSSSYASIALAGTRQLPIGVINLARMLRDISRTATACELWCYADVHLCCLHDQSLVSAIAYCHHCRSELTMDLIRFKLSMESLQVIQTSESSVSIEVPRNWRLWSGWCPRRWDGGPWKEWWNSMDGEDFDEATAFPTFKPDETIFHVGLPDYTRNQRGWYHVKPWPLRPPPTMADEYDRSATGGDVPGGYSDDRDILMSKREIGSISLVCRRWAYTVQRHIFNTITLRSGEDPDTLLSFLRHPHSSITRYIHMIILSQSLTQYPYLPWVHRPSVFNQVVGALKTETSTKLQLTLCGPLPAGKFTRGVCEMLPRSVPWSFRGVGSLDLKDLHFRKLGDLMRIPRELPSIWRLQCSNVTWEDTSSEELPPTSQYLSRRTNEPVAYYLRRCTDDRAAVWFAALLALRWRDHLQQSDAHQICRIASAFQQNGDEFVSQGYRFEDYLSFHASACMVAVYFTDRVGRQARRVRAIRLHVTNCSEERLKCSDWAMIDRLAAVLPSLGAFLVCSSSPDALLLFHNRIAIPKMPNFHSSSKSKYILQSRTKLHSIYTPVACSGDKVRTIDAVSDIVRCNSAWVVVLRISARMALMAVVLSHSFLALLPLSSQNGLGRVQTVIGSTSRDSNVGIRGMTIVGEWEEWGDPTIDKNFDEATAFPALKPDETVFHIGLPDYTRNQRGWYHIKPWPLHSPLTVGDRHERDATGGDVPVELFDIVLSFMRCNEETMYSGNIYMSKRELGLISLVCRRWARIVQRHIFYRITLRGVEDAHTLLSFLRNAHSSIARYIELVILSQSLTQYPYMPWVHKTFLFTEIMGVLKSLGRLRIALRGPLPTGKFTKGVCEMLPRSIPWFFIEVRHLDLKDLHFKKLGDLMRIPRELPSLQRLQCSNVTWEGTSSEELLPTSQYLSRQADEGVEYCLRECTDNKAAAWFAALLAPRRRDRLEESDAHKICHIASAFKQNVDEFVSQGDRYEDHLSFRAPSCVVRVYFTDRVAREARRVRAIKLDETYCSEERLKCSDWAMIDRLAMALPSLETLLVWFPLRDDLLLFHNKVVIQKMPNFSVSSKLKYALGSRKEKDYMYTPVACCRDKVHNIGPPVYSIRELL